MVEVLSGGSVGSVGRGGGGGGGGGHGSDLVNSMSLCSGVLLTLISTFHGIKLIHQSTPPMS